MAGESRSLILNHTFRSVRPYAHQVRALKRALDLDRSTALFMEPGTGKTRVAIDFVGIKHKQRGIQKVLCVCPNVAIGVWQDQIDEWLSSTIPRDVVTLDKSWGTVHDRIEALGRKQAVKELTFGIVNYDVIADMKDAIRLWRPDVIIADEVHFIKKHTSSRSKAMHYLSTIPRWKFGLSGTPITNSPLDIYSQYRFLDPDIFGARAWGKFKDRYAVYGGFGGYRLIKYRRLDELSKLTSRISFEATKDEMDLPDRTSQVIRVTMDPSTKKVYDQMNKEFIADIEARGLRATASIILTKMIRLNQICGGFVRITPEDPNQPKEDVQVGQEKLRALKELLKIHCKEGGYKVVVFARFKWETKKIHELCKKIGIPAVLDKGDKADRKRFQTDSKLKVFIVPLAQGGIAVNELVAANIGIFYSIDHSSDHITQAMDRLHRGGQTRNVLYLFLLMKGTWDEVMYRSFVEHKLVANEVVYKIRGKVK